MRLPRRERLQHSFKCPHHPSQAVRRLLLLGNTPRNNQHQIRISGQPWLKMGPLAYPGAVGVVRDVTCSHGSSQHQHQPMQPPQPAPAQAGVSKQTCCRLVRGHCAGQAGLCEFLARNWQNLASCWAAAGSRQVSGPLVGCTLLLGSQAGAAVARLGATSCGGQGPRVQLSPAVSPHLAGHLSAQGTVNLPSHQQRTTHPL